jgi:hypothetical protein
MLPLTYRSDWGKRAMRPTSYRPILSGAATRTGAKALKGVVFYLITGNFLDYPMKHKIRECRVQITIFLKVKYYFSPKLFKKTTTDFALKYPS